MADLPNNPEPYRPTPAPAAPEEVADPTAHGQIVTLKGGSIPMVVIGLETVPSTSPGALNAPTQKNVRCTWMHGDGTVEERLFHPHTLVAVLGPAGRDGKPGTLPANTGQPTNPGPQNFNRPL